MSDEPCLTDTSAFVARAWATLGTHLVNFGTGDLGDWVTSTSEADLAIAMIERGEKCFYRANNALREGSALGAPTPLPESH